MKLILASASPRRSELLESAGIPFKILPADVEELGEESCLSPADFSVANARLKARAVHASNLDHAVIGADTIVVLEAEILGKPKDRAEAMDMLNKLSNREHQVITGISIQGPGPQERNWFVTTSVVFRALSLEEITAYIATGEPMDKAGSYGIQGLAAQFVREIRGSYTNVVGLPLAEVVEALRDYPGT
jgi:septum formation protein